MSHQSTKIDVRAPKRLRTRSLWAAIVLGVGALIGAGLIAVFTGAGYVYVVSPTVRSVVQAIRQHDITPDRAFPGKDAVNLLVIGADQDRDNYKRVVGKAQRSDALMIARFDFSNERAAVVSIPRDTKIHIPGYRGYQKINAAYAYGGSDLSKKVVEGLLGAPIDYVVALNFDGFKKLVDMMGGVPISVDKPLNYDDNWGDLHVHLKPGNHWMNGQQALGFVRIRHVDSDMYRTGRQQQFLQAVKGRLSDPRIWWKIPVMVEEARKSIGTDLEDKQLLCIISFLKGLPKGALQTLTLPGDEGPSFVTLYPEKVREIARNLLAVDEAPLDGLGGRTDETRLARRDVSGDRMSRRRADRRRPTSGSDRSIEDTTWTPTSASDHSDEFSAPLEPSGPEAAQPSENDGSLAAPFPSSDSPKSAPSEGGESPSASTGNLEKPPKKVTAPTSAPPTAQPDKPSKPDDAPPG